MYTHTARKVVQHYPKDLILIGHAMSNKQEKSDGIETVSRLQISSSASDAIVFQTQHLRIPNC